MYIFDIRTARSALKLTKDKPQIYEVDACLRIIECVNKYSASLCVYVFQFLESMQQEETLQSVVNLLRLIPLPKDNVTKFCVGKFAGCTSVQKS